MLYVIFIKAYKRIGSSTCNEEVTSLRVLETKLSLFVNRIRELVNFELGKEIEKDVFHLVMGVERGKNLKSPGKVQGCRFDFSWGLRIFSLSHAHDRMKNIFL